MKLLTCVACFLWIVSHLLSPAALGQSKPPPDLVINTPLGVFVGCQEARSFRNNALQDKFMEQFVRMAGGVQDRVDSVLSDFKNHRDAARIALQKASMSQKKEVGLAVLRFLSLRILSERLGHMAVNRSAYKISESTAKAYKELANRSVGLSDVIVQGSFNKNVDALDVGGISIDTLSWGLGPASKVIVGIAQLGLTAIGPWLEWQPLKLAALGEFDAFEGAIKKIIRGSPAAMMVEINATRKVIDQYCPA